MKCVLTQRGNVISQANGDRGGGETQRFITITYLTQRLSVSAVILT